MNLRYGMPLRVDCLRYDKMAEFQPRHLLNKLYIYFRHYTGQTTWKINPSHTIITIILINVKVNKNEDNNKRVGLLLVMFAIWCVSYTLPRCSLFFLLLFLTSVSVRSGNDKSNNRSITKAVITILCIVKEDSQRTVNTISV